MSSPNIRVSIAPAATLDSIVTLSSPTPELMLSIAADTTKVSFLLPPVNSLTLKKLKPETVPSLVSVIAHNESLLLPVKVLVPVPPSRVTVPVSVVAIVKLSF